MPDQSFLDKYRALEGRMQALTETDGDIFLPNPEPTEPVQYVLICMEPSLGRWARSASEASARVAEGFRNFLDSIETAILHFAIRRYLCGPSERYHLTDFSKGAMLVDRAGVGRVARYNRWYALLQDELALVARPQAGIIAVGHDVAQHLERRGFSRSFARVIHYSGQAGRARHEGIAGREASFEAFRDSVSLEDLVATMEEVLTDARVPSTIRDATLSGVARSRLTTSRRELLFNYKLAFEAIRGASPSR